MTSDSRNALESAMARRKHVAGVDGGNDRHADDLVSDTYLPWPTPAPQLQRERTGRAARVS